MNRLGIITMLLTVFLVSCDDSLDTDHGGGRLLRATLSAYDVGGESVADGEAPVSSVSAYHFEDGVLTHVYDEFRASAFGYELSVSSRSGTLYVVALTDSATPPARPAIGTAEAEWLKTRTDAADMFFTGSVSLSGQSPLSVPLTLRRGMARYDMAVDVDGEAEIVSAIISNAALTGRLFPDGALPQVAAPTGDVRLAPYTYIHEQMNDSLKVTVDAVVDGRRVRLQSPLPPEVRRNTRYTVTLRKTSQQQDAYLTVVPWADGGGVEAFPDRSGALRVDAAASGLPQGAQLSADGRTLTLPHRAVDFTLKIQSDEQLELVAADGYLLNVEPQAATGTGDMNAFRVGKRLYAPGVAGSDVVVQFRRKGLSHVYPDDNIVLRLQPNPTTVSGPLDFDTPGYVHDFGRYVDNLLGEFTLPEGSSLSVEFAQDEDKWVRLDQTSPRTWRVTGGWRPNDPTADGRRQEAVIVVSDGQWREEYTIARRNYGLPVTWLHGVWWCKYNAMGRSSDFGDQILSSADPAAAAGLTVVDYLASCPPDDYRRLWQWAYQGGSGQGLRVASQGGLLVMDGFSADVSDHINKLPADALSPDGYELPSMSDYNRIFDATDYVWLMWNGTHTLKTPWNGHSQIRREQRRKNGLTVGDADVSDLIMIAMWSPDYPEHEPVVWYGPGAQWNSDGIMHAGHYNNILFGVHSPAGEGWYMAGAMNGLYLHRNGAGNRDTRILRFKKSDVDYIY